MFEGFVFGGVAGGDVRGGVFGSEEDGFFVEFVLKFWTLVEGQVRHGHCGSHVP